MTFVLNTHFRPIIAGGDIYLTFGLDRLHTSSKRALMMVIQCLMVVMQSGWHTARMASPMPAALFTSTLFSSTVCMKSRCVCSSACRVSTSSGRTPRKRNVCSASESHSSNIWTAERNSSACRKRERKIDSQKKILTPLLVSFKIYKTVRRTCLRACWSRVCLETDRAQTVSQRLLSSCSWTLTQAVSSRPVSISSRADRFRACTLLVLFPSSFWKTWGTINKAQPLKSLSYLEMSFLVKVAFKPH